MDTLTLPAQPRETGKAAVKATRKAGLVPCVLYGAHTEPVHFAVEQLALRPLIHTTETYRVAVSLGGEPLDALLKSVDFHPVTDRPIHADFVALTRGEAISMMVSVQLEGTPVGVTENGGSLSQSLHEVEVRAEPRNLPSSLQVDVSGLGIGDSLTVADLLVGEGIEILTDPSIALAAVSAPRTAAASDDADAAPSTAAPAAGD